MISGACLAVGVPAPADAGLTLEVIGRYESGIFDGAAAEISAFDPGSKRLFVVNAGNTSIDVLDLSDPTNPIFIMSIDTSSFGGEPNSVTANDGTVAVAIEADTVTDPGTVAFFDTSGTLLSSVQVGPVPDMLTFTPSGKLVVVANEGLPNEDYTVDPEGSISIIDVRDGASAVTQADVRTADFTAFNNAVLDDSVRIYGPGASVAQDLEPEYIAVAPFGLLAYASLQENNALAKINLVTGEVIDVIGLGFKDHSATGNELDASDRDGGIEIKSWPVFGMYLPDGLAMYRTGDPRRTYIVTADEGDDREYEGTPGFVEAVRVEDLVLDPSAFPNAASLQMESQLGRLEVSSVEGDPDGDGDYDALFAPGARSFSIWTTDGTQVFNSGSLIEQIVAARFPADFNSDRDENNSFDSRSDARGAEPSNVTIGRVLLRPYAFITLERMGGVMAFDITDPEHPRFCDYVNPRNFAGDPAAGTAGDLGPEGVLFIASRESPNERPLLVVSNEISGSVTIYRVRKSPGQCAG